jgi:flavin-dependent dehydrogenase
MSSNLALAQTYDVVIAGARCAGAATALLLARRGLRVLVVDRGKYGTDTLSTHALMRGGVLQLHKWGVLPDVIAGGAVPVRTTTFYYGGEPLAIPIKPRDGVDALYAPKRALLDRILVDHAVAAGAEIVHQVRLTGLQRRDDGRVCGAVLHDHEGGVHHVGAEMVVGADGATSSVADLVGAPIYRAGRHTGGVVYGHWSGLAVEGYRWYFEIGLSVGAIPTSEGETCIFVAVPGPRFRDTFRGDVAAGYRTWLARGAPDLAAAVADARPTENLHGYAGRVGYFRQSWGPGWALVGDAGYFKDPITAHGITDALRDAEALAAAVASGSDDALAAYQQRRDDLGGGLFEVSDAIASFRWDLTEAQTLHMTLADEMSREVKAMTDGAGAMVSPDADR